MKMTKEGKRRKKSKKKKANKISEIERKKWMKKNQKLKKLRYKEKSFRMERRKTSAKFEIIEKGCKKKILCLTKKKTE